MSYRLYSIAEERLTKDHALVLRNLFELLRGDRFPDKMSDGSQDNEDLTDTFLDGKTFESIEFNSFISDNQESERHNEISVSFKPGSVTSDDA